MMNLSKLTKKFINIHYLKCFKYQNSKKSLFSTKIDEETNNLKNFTPEYIRNFSIIAHIDHGKSTLANKMLELTNSFPKKIEQVFDKLQVERERGITVKAQTSSFFYKYNGKIYLFNLIDTPGHGDFSYEVSRSLHACQGVVLLVDSSEGIQARTVTNFKLAKANKLAIVPVLNKIDLENAQPDKIANQMKNIFEIDTDQIMKVSGKYGNGVTTLLDTIIERIPPPNVDRSKPFSALLFDLWYEYPRGVIALLSVLNGSIKTGDRITSSITKESYTVKDIAVIRADEKPVEALYSGQIGSISTSVLNTTELQIGDVFYIDDDAHAREYISEVKPAKPTVFAGFYPLHRLDEPQFRAAIDKLLVNDSSVSVTLNFSSALGQGYRLGFLGLLHMEVFKERLEQDYNAPKVFITTPNIPYKVRLKDARTKRKYGGSSIVVTNPQHLPKYSIVRQFLQPIVTGIIITPNSFVEQINALCKAKKGVEIGAVQIDDSTTMLQWKLPLREIIINYLDELKRISSGKATFDYQYAGYSPLNLAKLEIVINGEIAEELTTIVEWSKLKIVGKRLCAKLKDLIPQHVNAVGIEAKHNGEVVAMQTVPGFKIDPREAFELRYKLTQDLKEMRNQEKNDLRTVGQIVVPRNVFIKVLEYIINMMEEKKNKKILVTGASGLLGREIIKKFEESVFNAIGTCLNRADKYNLHKLDLTDFKNVEEFIDKTEPDFIIHSAAQRAPDQVDKNFEAAAELNVHATQNLARIAAIKTIPMMFISTDYVFDGNNPPFKDTDKPNPTNKYGLTKLEGEKITMDASSDNIVLRIPVLYGPVESPEESAVTCLLQNLLKKTPQKISDYEIRWPAHTSDIANICFQIIERKLKEPSVRGIYQWSGKEGMTKYKMIQVISQELSLNSDHIIPDKEINPGVPRPFNCQLDTSKLENLGIGHHTLFSNGIIDCLKKFIA
uniref:Translation factor GUF1 homolog, mitochondrial n=1 Tax=Strigamia maritima TaxID=126957 RepID=T1JJJ9_STRMM